MSTKPEEIKHFVHILSEQIGDLEDINIAKLSMAEEEKAIIDYKKRREQATNPYLKKILDFLITEEQNHRKLLNDWLDGIRENPPPVEEKLPGADIG